MPAIKMIIAITLLFTVLGCENNNTVEADTSALDKQTQADDIGKEIEALPLSDLTDVDMKGLILMREEEKLARDVYNELYDVHGIKIFSNIARSEARHMAALKVLLNRYGIEDPVKTDVRGVFSDSHLTDLYAQLTDEGKQSVPDAFIVGATIEDLDIKDLMDLSQNLEAADILIVYENLTKGSRNHLRAFYSQITRSGASYEPQFISKDLLDSIVNSPRERGWQ